MVSHQNLPTLRYLKEPAPVGEMELDHTVYRSGASIVPANPAEKPTKIPLLICDFDVPWRCFFSTTNLEPTQRIQNVTVSKSIRIHPSNILLMGKQISQNQKSLQWWKPGHSTSQLSCWLWRKVITWILRHKPRLDTEQFLPLWWLWPKGYQNSLGMPHPAPGWNLGVHKERQSECDKAPASIQCESAAPHFAGKMKIWRVLVQWWSGKLCLKSQILVRWSQKCIQWLKLQVCPKMPSGQNRQAWKSRSGPLRSTMQWTESVSPMLGRQLGSLCRL